MENLSDQELLRRLKDAVKREREAGAEVIALIAELDRRQLYSSEGCTSLFEYCCRELGYSEDETARKIVAARAARRLPAILSYVAGGEISQRAVSMLAPHLTEDNHMAVLESAARKPLRAVERIVAALAPQPDRQDSIRATRPVPLSPGRHLFQFTGSDELRAMIERAQDLIRRKHPKAALEDVIGEMARFYLQKNDPDLAAPPSAAALLKAVSSGRRIPKAVKRLVWLRDGGRCTFISDSGKRCTARTFLEYDHIKPYARGGRSDDPDNLRLRCRAHNQLYARQCFGEAACAPGPTSAVGRDSPPATTKRNGSVSPPALGP